uniref:Melanin concentrating hormone receptor 1 n=1 Tax=Accipiter nisus TaxID=211598 RepID=A0A8B9MSW5_9AVES
MPTPCGITCLLAVIGNSLVICTVLKTSGPSSSIPDIIISLSKVDLLFLPGMPFLIQQLLGNRAWHFGETTRTIITALGANSQFTSIYVLTAMSIDCYLATIHPFTSPPFRKPPIIPLWLYAQLIPLPGGLLGCGIHLPDPQRSIYWYTLYQFFLGFAIPFTLITARLTHAAIAICMAFTIFWAPFHSLQLAQLTMSYSTLPFYYTYNTAISLGYANSCLNPFIYILLGQNFQRQLGVPVRPAAAGNFERT